MLFELNKNILVFFNNLSNHKIVEIFVKIFADSPIFFLPVFLVSMRIYYTYKSKDNTKKQELLFIFYWVVIWLIIALVIQSLVDIDRPENYINSTWKLLLKHLPDASFPSDHATVSVAFLTSLFLAWYKRVWLIFLPFVIFMNLSRIIAGVHWPFDIIVWTIIWIISAFISFKFIRKFEFIQKLNNLILKIMGYIKL